MTTEQKAKVYDEAIKKAKESLEAAKTFDYKEEQVAHDIRETVYSIFPELKEPEDERIRKGIIDFLWEEKIFLQEAHSSVENNPKYRFVMDAIAWLEKQGNIPYSGVTFEYDGHTWGMCARDGGVDILLDSKLIKHIKKQGEQKPADKVEPKFNIGDWIVYNRIDSSKEILYVYDIRDNKYYFNDMCHFSWSVKECDEKCHLWTIRDAKDGDVLYYISDAGIEYIVMNKGININNNVDSYFRYNSIDGFAIDIPSVLSADNDSIIPATKEQCDFLFQKMKEAGYTWDYEKKELRKIEQESANKVKPKFEIEGGKWYVCNTSRYIDFIVGEAYYCPKNGMLKPNENTIARYVARDCFHPWTIQDAKDGDVLSNGEMIVIFKHFEEPSYRQHIVAYIGLDRGGDIQITDDTWMLGIDKAKPATKEQRDLLFQKMHEAGLEWNSEKKELKKIEQKSTDKAEPKFKVGDWVSDSIGVAHKIERTVLNVTNNTFGYDIVGGGYFNDDSDVHLWTIKDAKEGDVVVDKSDGTIGIFQSIGHHPDGGSCNDPSYCFLHCSYDDGFFYADFEGGNMIDSYDLIPATKEQRDLLFSEMKEAGYEWDADKKKLKKIDEDGVEYKKHIMSELVNLATAYVKQKSEPAWSEEDEKNWRGVIDEIGANKSDAPDYDVKTYDRFLSWLKSIKQRLGGEK